MFRAAFWTLRQRRYRALAITMAIVALVCIGMGSFEIHRFAEKRHDNGTLQSNARVATAPLSSAFVPLTGHGVAPGALAIRYRHVSATGRFDAGAQQYVGDQTQGGRQGFYVLTPLRTAAGTLLVVRGFVAATAAETRPAVIAAPPSGTVPVTGWLDTAQTANDRLGTLGHGEITAINPVEQAARLSTPTYQAFLTLTAHQPGTAGLSVVPLPDLSNPTGGAVEWQLFSYILQWYVFAFLALLVPFLFARSEIRDARRRFLGYDPATIEIGQLDPAESRLELGAGSSSDGEVVVRAPGTLAERDPAAVQQRWERAVRLADRYGRSLGPDAGPELAALAGGPPEAPAGPIVRDSSAATHRSEDEYHGSYNDYLWQLALADGAVPDVAAAAEQEAQQFDRRALDGLVPRPIQPRGATPADDDER